MSKKANVDVSSPMSINVLFAEIANKKFIIIGIIAFSMLCSFIYTKFFCTPMYRSCAKLVIVNNESEQISTNDFAISSYLVRDYSEIILDRVVLDEVKEQLDLKYSYGRIRSSITVNNPSRSRILEVYVSDSDPKIATEIANKVCEVSQQKILDILSVDKVSLMSEATTPILPSSPNMRKNVTTGLIIGILTSLVLLVILYHIDDKIKGTEDVRKYLNLSTLGVIPYNRNKVNEPKKQNSR